MWRESQWADASSGPSVPYIELRESVWLLKQPASTALQPTAFMSPLQKKLILLIWFGVFLWLNNNINNKNNR